MANLRTDSPICIRIVLAFLDFLSLVQAAPGINIEGLEVVQECSEEVFNLKHSSFVNETPKGFLIKLFSSPDPGEQTEIKSEPSSPASVGDIPSTSSGGIATMQELARSGRELLTLDNLADSLKSQGNSAMVSNLYLEAIELYSCAIALCRDNAIHYCNRAAAFIQIQKYTEAIRDCLKSVHINPKYRKAYGRLGLAYYGQGNYIDDIFKGYVKEVAEQKLRDKYRRMQDQIIALEQPNEQEPTPGASSVMKQARGATAVAFANEPRYGEIPPPPVRAAIAEILQGGQESDDVTPEINLEALAELLESMFPPPSGGNPEENSI